MDAGHACRASAGIPCWCNRLAREGRYNLDPDIKFFATPPHHGSLAEVRREEDLQSPCSCLTSLTSTLRNQLLAASVHAECFMQDADASCTAAVQRVGRSMNIVNGHRGLSAWHESTVTACLSNTVRGPPGRLLLPAAGPREPRGGRHVRAAQRRRARLPPRRRGARQTRRNPGRRPNRYGPCHWSPRSVAQWISQPRFWVSPFRLRNAGVSGAHGVAILSQLGKSCGHRPCQPPPSICAACTTSVMPAPQIGLAAEANLSVAALP